jgi:hypothetical protein
MFKLFTKNLDTMEKATKNNLEGLHDLNRLNKDDMNKFLGGNDKDDHNDHNGLGGRKKKGKFWNLFGPNPCSADLPQ